MEEIERSFPGNGEEASDKAEKESEDGASKSKESSATKTAESGGQGQVKTQQKEDTEVLEETDEKSVADDFPADSAPFPVSSSSGSEADSTSGPSTAENSQSLVTRDTDIDSQSTDMPDIVQEKVIVGGRASIPDELQPDQLEKLQNLKESNA